LNPTQAIKPGDKIRILKNPRRFKAPSDLMNRIIRESDDSILVDKPAGLPVESEIDNIKENLVTFLENIRGQRFFLTHRLSTESEGLILLAKNTDAKERISHAFALGKIKRNYVAFTEAPVKIGEHAPLPITVLACEELTAKTNLLADGPKNWEILGDPIQRCYRVQIEFTTLRPKEMRAHLADCGAPIVGDEVFGSRLKCVDPKTHKPAIAYRATELTVMP
jgi:23S rRNA-/tRNA-specific pseudouridylate synthase